MIRFEEGKVYSTGTGEKYILTKHTSFFVTFTSVSETYTFRCRVHESTEGSESYEWVSVPGSCGQGLDAREAEAPVSQPEDSTAAEIVQPAQEVQEQAQSASPAPVVSYFEQQAKKKRRKANYIFRKLTNEQLTAGLNYYREAMEFAETYDFSYIGDVTTEEKVEVWLREGLTGNWVDAIDEMARSLNVKPKGSRYFCAFDDAEQECQVVENLVEKISLIGSDARALKVEEAYKQELENKRREAEEIASQYVSVPEGELIQLSNADVLNIRNKYNGDTSEIIMRAIAEHNCHVFGGSATREELIAKVRSVNEREPAYVAYYMYGKLFRGYDCTPSADYASRFADWFMTTEHGAKIGLQSEEPAQEYDASLKARKDTRHDLHEAWCQRRVLRKCLRLLGECSDDARILRNMCYRNAVKLESYIEHALKKYKEICLKCASGRMYDADSRLADALACEATTSSCDIGKKILSEKGNPESQREILRRCSEDFLLDMMSVFYCPRKVNLSQPEDVIEWMRKGVLKCASDGKYARTYLNIARTSTTINENLAGWIKFLEEYARPESKFGEETERSLTA